MTIKQIFLPRGFVALVSVEDYDLLARYNWRINTDVKGNTYACRYEGGKRIYMHREITDCPDNLVVDHINGNKLDNRRTNLRVCTKKENLCNVIGTGLSGFKGVSRTGKKWRARIVPDDVTDEVHIGTYPTAESAARAYDAAAVILFGEYAWLNFPIERKETEVHEEHPIPF